MKVSHFGYVFLLLVANILSTATTNEDKVLQLVQVLYRHGDRSPVKGYPNQNYSEETWKKFGAQGYGQLTWKGMEQQYKLGQYFKKHYIDGELKFLSPEYDPRKIYIRSTDIDRTLMSAYCNLAGMYPPTGNSSPWNVNDSIQWQPIPVHTVPVYQDSLLSMDSDCPHADYLYSQEQETDEFKSKSQKYKTFLEFLSNKTGSPHEDLDNLWETIDTLYCEKAHNLTLPDWSSKLWPQTNMTVYDTLMSLQTWEFELKYGLPAQKAKLRGGPLLKQMLKNMNDSISNKVSQKFYMYSAHDNTVTAFLNAVKAYNNLLPHYTATVMVELYRHNGTNKYSVRMLYKNVTDSEELHNLTIPGCAIYCPYDEFMKLTADMVPANWLQECMIPAKSTVNEGLIIGIGVGSGILFILVIMGIVYVIRKKRGSDRYAQYYNINEDA